MVGWIIAVDRGRLGGRLHFHILVFGVAHLNRTKWWKIAFRRFGRARIVPYDNSLPGARYVAENALSDNGGLHFGGSLFEGGDAATEHNGESGRRGPGRPRVTPPDPRVIDYFRRRGVSWRAMARMFDTSTGTLRRAYDAWLQSRGWTRAEIGERYRTSAPGWRNAPPRATNRRRTDDGK